MTVMPWLSTLARWACGEAATLAVLQEGRRLHLPIAGANDAKMNEDKHAFRGGEWMAAGDGSTAVEHKQLASGAVALLSCSAEA